MSKEIIFSIIIPNYNSGHLLDQTLGSIFSNECAHSFEVLVMDNLSTDNPQLILANYPTDLISFYSEIDNGIYDAMNKGVRLAKGHWIIFLGAGDELLIDYLNQIKFNEFLNLKLIYGDTFLVKKDKIYDGEFNLLKLMKRNISHQAVFYNRQVFNEIGLFDTSFKVTADYLYNLKIFMIYPDGYQYLPFVISNFLGGGLSDRVRENFFQDNKLKIISVLVFQYFSLRNLYALVKYQKYYLKNYIQLKIG